MYFFTFSCVLYCLTYKTFKGYYKAILLYDIWGSDRDASRILLEI